MNGKFLLNFLKFLIKYRNVLELFPQLNRLSYICDNKITFRWIENVFRLVTGSKIMKCTYLMQLKSILVVIHVKFNLHRNFFYARVSNVQVDRGFFWNLIIFSKLNGFCFVKPYISLCQLKLQISTLI